MKVQRDGRPFTAEVTADREGLVSHAGSSLLSQVADESRLPVLSRELWGMSERRSGHERGRVVRDLAVMLADGGEALADLPRFASRRRSSASGAALDRPLPPRAPRVDDARRPAIAGSSRTNRMARYDSVGSSRCPQAGVGQPRAPHAGMSATRGGRALSDSTRTGPGRVPSSIRSSPSGLWHGARRSATWKPARETPSTLQGVETSEGRSPRMKRCTAASSARSPWAKKAAAEEKSPLRPPATPPPA